MLQPIIEIQGIGKRYRIGATKERYLSLRDEVAKWLSPTARRARAAEEEFWALRDVSFSVAPGEAVGIIGRNGAGKSTLLKILSQITPPTEGKITMRGRVGSLLEVGTGFHPELTGRENIYMNGAILGMSRREIARKFDEIVAFAEMEKFLDTPVKRYSSGMYVRLAFAVAAHLEPEILVIDEVLAVGDAQFQNKCLGKMGEVAKHGRTVLFVSHNMGAVSKLCPRSLWIEAGKLLRSDQSSSIIQDYLATTYHREASVQFELRDQAIGQIKSVRVLNEHNLECADFPGGQEPTIEIGFLINQRIRGCHLACIVTTGDGFHVFSTADTDMNPSFFEDRLPGEYLMQVRLPTRRLNVGMYHLAVSLGIPSSEPLDRQNAISFTIHDAGDFGTMKEGSRRAGLLLVEAEWKYLQAP